MQRILREALGSPHVDSRAARGPSRDALLRLAQPNLSIKVRDLDQADAILVVGTDPLHSSPILDLRILKIPVFTFSVSLIVANPSILPSFQAWSAQS